MRRGLAAAPSVSAVAEAIDESLQASLRLFLGLGQLGKSDVGALLILGKSKVCTLLSFGILSEHPHALLDQFGDAIQTPVDLVHATVRTFHTTLRIGLALQNKLDRAFDIHGTKITRGIIPMV